MIDPVRILHKGIENSWPASPVAESFPNVYYSGVTGRGSPGTAPDDTALYCQLNFGDATKYGMTNISIFWSVPVKVKVFDVSAELLRPKVSALIDFLGEGQNSLAGSGITLEAGGFISIVAERVYYEQLDAMRWRGEFEMRFRLSLPRCLTT